jgi:hypothetical protein
MQIGFCSVWGWGRGERRGGEGAGHKRGHKRGRAGGGTEGTTRVGMLVALPILMFAAGDQWHQQ